MIRIDLTQSEAYLSWKPSSQVSIWVQDSRQEDLVGGLFRINRNGKRTLVAQKMRSPDAPRVFHLQGAGHFEARSSPGGRIGNAFTLEFRLNQNEPKWEDFTLEVLRVNEPMAFHVLDQPVILLDPNTRATWRFTSHALGALGPPETSQAGVPRLRFDRLDTFEVS